MSTLQIISAIGDTPTRTIPLVVDVDNDLTPFAPDVNWNLLLSAKTQLSDDDSQSKFQLQTGAGITVVGTSASCLLARQATVNLKAGNLPFDIRATHQTTGETHIVARGRWQLVRPATLLAVPSVTIYTITPPDGTVRASVLTYDVAKYTGAMFVTDAGTLRILTAADHGKTLIFTNAAAIAVTLNNGLPSCFYCTIVQAGAGVVTVSGTATLQRMVGYGAKTSGQFSQISAANYGLADTYLIGGALGI